MSATSLYDSLRSYLRMSARVVSKVGGDINVGEKFTVRFTGSNTAASPNVSISNPAIIFNKTKVYVYGTAYAAPVAGNQSYDLPDASLFPGEASHVDVEFKALKDLSFWQGDWFREEHVAKAWITADLDQNRFFTLWNYMDFREEIDPT